MKTKKQLGIWMDHSIAHLIEVTEDQSGVTSIDSRAEPLDDEQISFKGESHMMNKEQEILSTFYKKITDKIKDYDEVLLFGPTDAKSELFNQIDNIHQLSMIKITIKTTDKMTENQQQAFVRDFFNKTEKSSKSIQNRSFFFFLCL